MPPSPRFFTVIPAAGHSRRMGTDKLLLPVGGEPLLVRVAHAWRAAELADWLIVTRADNGPLQELARNHHLPVLAVAPPPADMKASVQAGLQEIARRHQPAATDAWLLAPADSPRLNASIIRQVCRAYQESLARTGQAQIHAPVNQSKRGHPVAIPWRFTAELAELPASAGMNTLLHQHPVVEVPIGELDPYDDLDDSAAYRHLLASMNRREVKGDR